MFIKIHESYRKVVAVCDGNILGKKFEEGKKQLDVRESFYNGDEVDYDKALEMLRSLKEDDTTFNIAGEESINAALEAGLINEESIGEVEGVKFALVLL